MISVYRLLAASFLISAISPAFADEQSCPAPGLTSRWVMAFCFARHETDDPAHHGVSDCFADERAPQDKAVDEDCETNLKYKSAICSLWIEYGTYEESLWQCVQSPETTPRVVTYGVG